MPFVGQFVTAVGTCHWPLSRASEPHAAAKHGAGVLYRVAVPLKEVSRYKLP